MKRFFFLAVLFLAAKFQLQAQVYGTPIYTWDFANGLPQDWESGIVSTNNIAHWEYRGPATTPDINVGSRGSCAGTALPINSVTKANGFMIFDSNYWDDGDMVCGGLGSGVDPAPHNAWLTTNAIDLSSNSNVVLTFQQQFRHYQTTVTKVDVSINNGAWSEILVNTGNQSPTTEWKSVNVSSIAGGESNVRFRFSFVGVYYWWLLDDITLYTPNENDIRLNWVGYTTNPLGQAALPYSDLQYDQYPSVMIPPFSFRSSATNIGSSDQNNVSLNARVVRNQVTETYNSSSTPIVLPASSGVSFTISPNYTNPATQGNYKIYYNMLQDESDQVPSNDIDSLDYSITPYTYARDEGPMTNAYESTGIYTQWPYEIGNMFQTRSANKYCHSLQVAIADGTLPGAQIRGILYAENMETVIGQTNIYTVNVAELNSVGEEKVVTLHFPTPIALTNGAYYMAMVSQLDVNQMLKIARSGSSPSETSFVRYVSVNGNFYSTTTPIVRMNIFNAGISSGCMDATAMNFNPAATTPDGSCKYPGCTDETATNYNPSANWENGTCVIEGCTNPLAENYNPNATIDNGTCNFLGCTDEEADNYDPIATEDDGSCIYSGCTNPIAVNYDPIATVDDGSCIILGCLDADADNYNPLANQDDGSCIYFGCTNIDADNFDPTANTDDGSCLFSGCTNPIASNYDPQANVDDGSCIILGCTDVNADNYNEEANEDDGTCIYLGCTDPAATNYDLNANSDDGSCEYLTVAMSLSTLSGCAPLTVTVVNQTVLAENSSCTFFINDDIIEEQCVDQFEYTFENAGTYELTYHYQINDSWSDSTVTITVNPSPETPLIGYDAAQFEVTCFNCPESELQWLYESEIIADSINTSVGIAYENVWRNGFYHISVSNEFQCTTLSESLYVLQPNFEISQDEGCAPLELTITNLTDPVDDIEYSLNFGDGNVNDNFDEVATHSYSNANTYTLVLSASSPLGSGTYSKIITTHPVITPILVHVPDDGLVVCQNCNLFETVQWDIDGTIFNDFGPHSDGGTNYTVTGTTIHDCSASFTLNPTSIVNLKALQSSFEVYPNPANEMLTLNHLVQRGFSIEVYSNTGELILAKQSATSTEKLDVSAWSAGLYLLKLTDEGSSHIFRLSVVH